jgi:hypothetical protein
MFFKKYFWLLALTTIIVLASRCSDDHGVAPLPGNLALDVIFINNKIPTDTQGIYLFIAPTFPPHAINEMFLSPNSLPFKKLLNNVQEGARDTLYTEMNLPYGHYEAIGLWWYNKNTESNLADVFTLKIGSNLLPAQIDITPENPFVHTDLWANLTRVERDASIEGTITFNGPFPENTLATAIAAYSRKPVEKVEYLVFLLSMDFSIDKNPYHFVLPVSSRNKKIDYLAVFWLAERSGLDNFRTIGFYRDPNNPENPGVVKIKANTASTGYDIQADWSLIGN